MNVLSIGTDRKIFEEGSAVRARMVDYGEFFDGLHIIIFSLRNSSQKQRFQPTKISSRVWIYPTNSRSRWTYVFDAIKIGKKIIAKKAAEAAWSVTAQDPFETGFAAVRLASSARIPLQIQVHTDFLSPYFAKNSLLNRVRVGIASYTLPRADTIRVVSERIKTSIVKRGYALKTVPVILPIYVDAAEFERGHFEHGQLENGQLALDLHKKYPQFEQIILMVSRLSREKNIRQAIRVFYELHKDRPKVGLIIVGSGPELKTLMSDVHKRGMEQSVVFIPWQNDLASYYKTADVFLHTSLYEGYGLVLAEAALAHCPIVTSRVGIVGNELPEDACLASEPNDTEAFFKHLRMILSDKSLRLKMADAANKAVRATLIPKETYLSRYKELL